MVLKEALFYKQIKEKIVQCELCPHYCTLKDGEIGKCYVRQNIQGKLRSLVYGKPCSTALDPIEKKPLYHFLPGEKAFSIATVGCNLRCMHCQNAEISQTGPSNMPFIKLMPKEVIKGIGENRIISYTYTEPTIFYEYMLDIAKLAREKGIKNTSVTNGFINKKPLIELCKYLNGSNIDLKSIDNEFYKRICQGKVEPVLEAIKLMKKKKIWIEITNLLIPGLNDSLYDIRKLISWIRAELGVNAPLHFTSFYPCYKLSKTPSTNPETLKRARRIAMEQGLNYVYTGNIHDDEGNNTYCPNCKKIVIRRQGFMVIENKLKNGKCGCGEKIAGVWK